MFQKKRNLQAAAAATAGLKISSKKTKDLWINAKITTHIHVNYVSIETVQQFTYLGGTVMVGEGVV